MKKFIVIVLFVIYNLTANAQVIEPIDSLYFNAINVFSKNINNITKKVWPGMQIGPFCIFRLNGPAFLMNHPNPPANGKYLKDSVFLLNQSEYGFVGATQTEVNHYLTAHNDYGNKVYASLNQFYAELYHELHHVYQRNYIKNLQFGNSADILTYPENYMNDALKQYENEVLLEMFLGAPDKFDEKMNMFYTCRNTRKQIIGAKYIDFEKGVESAEGPATYCEYMYMQQFASIIKEQEYINNRFYYSLIEPRYGRDALRAKYLLTGLMQCLILSNHFENWQPEYYKSGSLLNDFFFSKFEPKQTSLPDLECYKSKAKYFTVLEIQNHKTRLESFNNQNGLKITLKFKETPDFKGFDPMNAEALNDSLILHTTMLKLAKSDSNQFSAINYKVITSITDQIWFVKSLTFFTQENTLLFDNNRFICNNGNVDINWEIVDKLKKGNEYVITLK